MTVWCGALLATTLLWPAALTAGVSPDFDVHEHCRGEPPEEILDLAPKDFAGSSTGAVCHGLRQAAPTPAFLALIDRLLDPGESPFRSSYATSLAIERLVGGAKGAAFERVLERYAELPLQSELHSPLIEGLALRAIHRELEKAYGGPVPPPASAWLGGRATAAERLETAAGTYRALVSAYLAQVRKGTESDQPAQSGSRSFRHAARRLLLGGNPDEAMRIGLDLEWSLRLEGGSWCSPGDLSWEWATLHLLHLVREGHFEAAAGGFMELQAHRFSERIPHSDRRLLAALLGFLGIPEPVAYLGGVAAGHRIFLRQLAARGDVAIAESLLELYHRAPAEWPEWPTGRRRWPVRPVDLAFALASFVSPGCDDDAWGSTWVGGGAPLQLHWERDASWAPPKVQREILGVITGLPLLPVRLERGVSILLDDDEHPRRWYKDGAPYEPDLAATRGLAHPRPRHRAIRYRAERARNAPHHDYRARLGPAERSFRDR